MIKTMKKAIVSFVMAAGAVGLISGCGSDKFEGDWSNEVELNESTLMNEEKTNLKEMSPLLTQVHIEKKGDGYLVTQANYNYMLHSKVNKDKKSGITYSYPMHSIDLVWEHVCGRHLDVNAAPGTTVTIQEEATVADYNCTLTKHMEFVNTPATVADKGTVLAVKANQYINVPFNYVEKDKTLIIPIGSMGDKLVLKKTSKDSLKDYMDSYKKSIKEILEKDEQKVKDMAAENKIKGLVSVSGDVNFNDEVANK